MTPICIHAWNDASVSFLEGVDRGTTAMLHCWNYCQNHQK